jgi:hypothetical protein
MIRALLLIGFLGLTNGSAFAGNTIDDSFGVKKIEGGEATVNGKVKDLKAGDTLYFPRPPYQFKVKSVDEASGNVVVELPPQNDLAVGNALLRYSTPQIDKFLKTENRLKEALQD